MLQKKTTVKKELIVQNRSGIHARVSTMIAQRCKGFASETRLHNGSVVADCRSVIDLLSLGACCGTAVQLEVTGEDAAEVVNVITAMFEARFNEDEESSSQPPLP